MTVYYKRFSLRLIDANIFFKRMKLNRNSTIIASVTQGPRLSNIELLRIFATFLVLVVHADFWALGKPEAIDFLTYSSNAIVRTTIESISIVCVNVFILISGWFGIKFKRKGLISFVFQCAYFLIGIYLVMLVLGKTELSLKGIAECLCLTKANWFIRAYIGLYILSPVLNTYIENSSQQLQRVVLILFFSFQTVYGWTNAAEFIRSGYSTFSFIGLYLLANYIRHHHTDLISRYGSTMFVMTVIANTSAYCLVQLPHVYSYVNPLVIMGALGLLGFFWSLNIKQNTIINWISKSAFASFLLHTNPNLLTTIFKPNIVLIYNSFSGLECIGVICGFLCIVFFIGIVLDQPRKWLWRLLSKSVFQ